MTDAQVKAFVEAAHKRGCPDFDDYDAKVYLLAQEILGREPGNAAARGTLEHLNAFMSTGVRPREHAFDEFELPVPETEEDIASPNSHRDAFLKSVADIPPWPIVAKIQPFFRPHATVPGWLEGARSFLKRTGLTVAEVEKMSEADLAKFA
jgi:hypothetical protein